MSKAPARVTFTGKQRQRLQRLGLLDAQIDQIQTTALPLCSALLGPVPPLQEVLDEFGDVTTAISKAYRALESFARAKPSVAPARFEALQRTIEAAYKIDQDDTIIDFTISRLQDLHSLLVSARSITPKKQRRRDAGSWQPVALIKKALLDGFIKHHGTPTFPAYLIRVSRSEKSQFRGVVEACYQAIGHPSGNPERAIRAYIKLRRTTSVPD